jgi:hypothetical protein
VGWSIGKAGQVGVVVTSPSSFAFQSAYTAAASGGNGSGAIIWALRPGSTAAGAAINSSTGVVSATSVGTVIFRAYRTGDGNYFDSAYTADFTVTVTPKPVTFSISPTSFTYSGGSQGPTVSPSDGAATWSVTAGQQSAVNAGSYSLTATANGNYSGSSGAVAWSIGKANQAALAPSASPSVVAYGNTSALAASGGSGTGLVSFSATAGGAVAGSTFTALAGTGSVTVTATKAADANFNAASGTATITLAARPVTIALSGSRAYDGTTGFSAPLAAVPSGLVSGDTLFGAAAAGAIPGTYSGLSGVVIRNGSNVDVTSFYGVSFSGSYVVTKAAQTAVSVTSPAAGTYGNAFTATGSGGSGSGSLVWSLGTGSTASAAAINPSSGAITSTGAGTVVIKAMRAGDTNYLPSAWSADFTVTLAPRPLTVTLTGSKFYDGTTTASGASAAISSGSLAAGDALGNSFANTSSANTGTYSGLNTAAVTNSSAPTTRTSSYVITYAGVFTIAAAPQTITFGALPGKTYGDAPFGLTATASSGLPVSFSVSSGPASISGTTVTITGAGAVTIVASQSGNSNYQAAPGVSQSFTVAQAAQTVTLSPISQTILQTQSVSFTAAGGQNGYVWGGTSGASGSGASKVVSFPTAGTFTVTVQSPNAGNYLASSLVTATVTVNAAFTLTLTAEPGGNVSGAGLYQAGSVVNIAATTNPGRVFAGWYGPNAGSLADPYANTGTVVVSADLSLSARFLDYTVAPTVGTVNFGDASIPTGAGAKQALRDAIMGNSGNSSIELRSMTVVSGGTDFSVTGALGQIAAGGNITNTVTFNPKGATLGPRTGRMVVATTDYAMPLFAYDLTANATSGALPPTLTLSVTSLALIFPNDNLLLNVRAEANTGNVAHYDWRVVTPSGPTGWTRASGPLALLVGNHAFSPTAIGAYVLEVIASHEAGLTSTGSLAFTVTQGMVTRVLNARSEPSPALQLWFTPSINRSQAIDVMKAR